MGVASAGVEVLFREKQAHPKLIAAQNTAALMTSFI
jgi:hypothetical protein